MDKSPSSSLSPPPPIRDPVPGRQPAPDPSPTKPAPAQDRDPRTGRVDWVRGQEAIHALGPVWRHLFAAAGSPSPFLAWEWAESWLEAFAAWDRAVVLVLRPRPAAGPALDPTVDDPSSSAVALLPLMRETARWGGLWPHPALRLLGDGPACPDHLDLLAAPGWGEAAARAFVAALCQDPAAPPWRALWWEGLAAASPLPAALANRPDLFLHALPDQPCRILPLPATWEAYVAPLTAKHRNRLEGRERRLARDSGLVVRLDTLGAPQAEADTQAAAQTGTETGTETGAEAERTAAIEALITLHQRVQTDRGNPGSFARPEMRRLVHLVAARFAARGWLRLTRLTAGADTLAVILCFCCGGVTAFYTIGHDPNWQRFNPGRMVMTRSLRQAIADGAQTYDFLRGEEGYKAQFTDRVTRDRRLIATRGAPGRLGMVLHRTVKALRRHLRRRRR